MELGPGALPSWSSGILRSLFRALCWTSGRLEKFCMTSAGDRAGWGGLGSGPICEPPTTQTHVTRREAMPLSPPPGQSHRAKVQGQPQRPPRGFNSGDSLEATQRVMGFNWTQLSASKAHDQEMGRLGRKDPGGAPCPQREAAVAHWG